MIRSPEIDFDKMENFCFSFWHLMFGEQIGALEVHLEFSKLPIPLSIPLLRIRLAILQSIVNAKHLCNVELKIKLEKGSKMRTQ